MYGFINTPSVSSSMIRKGSRGLQVGIKLIVVGDMMRPSLSRASRSVRYVNNCIAIYRNLCEDLCVCHPCEY